MYLLVYLLMVKSMKIKVRKFSKFGKWFDWFFRKLQYGILTANSFSVGMKCTEHTDFKYFDCLIHMLEGQRLIEQHPEVYRAVCVL